MGEMADDFLDSVMDFEATRMDWRMGRLSTEDAYDKGVIDENGYEPYPRAKTCRCCGQTGLEWSSVDGKFRLFDGDSIHVCPVNPLR